MPLTLVSFNLKDQFLPRRREHRAAFEAKSALAAETLTRADGDIVSLQEVGEPAALEAVLARLPAPYPHVTLGTADARGIRCAILSRLPLLSASVHTADSLPFPVFARGDAPPFGARIPLRRGVVHVRANVPGFGALDAFAVHFKSRRPVPLRSDDGAALPPHTGRERAEGELRALVWRGAEALFVRGLVDETLRADPARHVAVLGDFNDVAGSVPYAVLAGGSRAATGDAPSAADAPGLYGCVDALTATERTSAIHDGAGVQIDHVLVTAGLRARVDFARLFNEVLRDHGPADESAPPPPDSDHAAIVVRFA
jgi:endonuclease/exonuclease/phosphatase family metal-dependent hydrolase